MKFRTLNRLPWIVLIIWASICGVLPLLCLYILSSEYWVDFVQIYPHFFAYPLLVGMWASFFVTPCIIFVCEYTRRKAILVGVLILAIIASSYTTLADISAGDPAIWEISSFETLKTDANNHLFGDEMRRILEDCPKVGIVSTDNSESADSECDNRRRDLRSSVKKAYESEQRSAAHYAYAISLFFQTLTIALSICGLAFLLNFKFNSKLETRQIEKQFSLVFFCYLIWFPFRIFALQEKSNLYLGASFLSEVPVMVVIFMANIYLLIAAWKNVVDRLRVIVLTVIGLLLLILLGINYELALFVIGRNSNVVSYPLIFFIFLFMFLPFILSINGSLVHKRVFFSYSRKDIEFANELKESFAEAGISIRIDSEDMRPGEEIERFIRDSINKTSATVLIVSKSSLISSWVGFEARRMEGREWLSDDSSFLIPCNIDKDFFEGDISESLFGAIDDTILSLQHDIRSRHDLGRASEDLDSELRRAQHVRDNLDTLLYRLKQTFVVDFTKGTYDENAQKLVNEVKTRLTVL